MKQISILAALACLGTAGCGGDGAARPESGAAVAPLPTDWRAVATAADRERLRNWRTNWVEALAEARGAGRGADIRREGVLLDPDRALPGATPPAGDYRCRTIKVGTRGMGGLAYIAYPFFDCRIDDEGQVRSFHKRSGSQRPVGLIFADGAARAVFLGTMVLGDETMPLQYGQDAARDLAGIVERVGDRRWRIALPAPAYESKLDVVELVPAG